MNIVERENFDLETPVGAVKVLYLPVRDEFVKMVATLAYKGDCTRIPDSMGAVSFFGIKNWNRIHKVKAEILGEEVQVGQFWNLLESQEEENFCKDVYVIVTKGYYSNLSPSAIDYSEEMWIEKSLTLRIYHELTHVICRKKFSDMIEPIWDEILADYMGIMWAFGSYNVDIAEKCLGIYGEQYVEGGRLQNYVKDGVELANIFQEVKEMIASLKEIQMESDELQYWELLDRIQDEHRASGC